MTKNITRTIRTAVTTIMTVDTSTGTTTNMNFTFPFETSNNAKILKKVQTEFMAPNQVAVAVQSLRVLDQTYTMPIDLFTSLANITNTTEVHALEA